MNTAHTIASLYRFQDFCQRAAARAERRHARRARSAQRTATKGTRA